MPSRLGHTTVAAESALLPTDLLIHSQLSSHDTTRQIRSLAPRKDLLFFDFYHHVGNCQRHTPTRPDAGSVLPLRYPNSVRFACPYAKSSRSRWHGHSASFRFEIPDAAEHLGNWLSWQGPEAIRSFSSQVVARQSG